MNINKLINQWDKENSVKISTHLSDLKIGEGFLDGNKVAYNDSINMFVVDERALNELTDIISQLDDLSLEEYVYRVTPTFSMNSEAAFSRHPFSRGDLKKLSIDNEDKLRRLVQEIDIFQHYDFKPRGGGVMYSSFMINIRETFEGFNPLDIVKLLFHIASGTGFKPKENYRVNKDTFSMLEIENSALYFFLQLVKHKYNDDRAPDKRASELAKKFKEDIVDIKSSRNQFSDYVYTVWQQAKSLFTLLNLLHSERLVYHTPFNAVNFFRPEPFEMMSLKHPIAKPLEEYISSSEINKHEIDSLRRLYRFPFKGIGNIPKDFFLTIFENIRNSKTYNTSTGIRYKSFSDFLTYLNVNFPIEYLDPSALKRIANANLSKRNPNLLWAKGKVSSEIRDLLSEWLKQRSNTTVADNINLFLDYIIYLSENTVEITRLEQLRASMFFDVMNNEITKSFFEFIKLSKRTSNTNRSIWSTVHQCLTWCFNKLSLKNEVSLLCPMPRAADVFKLKGVNLHQTSRRPMPSTFYDILLEVVTEDDYKNTRSPQKTTLLNSETGKKELVYFKNIARIIHLLLLIPLRSHQVRWLDEGLLDDEIYDYQHCRYVKNTSYLTQIKYSDGNTHSKKFGRTGLLRASYNDDITELGLFINTNKTGLTSLAKKGNYGYELNWPAETGIQNVDKVYEIILEQIEFNRKYASTRNFTTPVKVVDETAAKYQIGMWEDMPYHIPLFRDPRQMRISDRIKLDQNHSREPLCLPPSAESIRSVFYKVLEIADKRYKERYPEYTNRSVAFDSKEHRIFDVHTLRVYGITSLLEQGLSLETVQALVGHATSLMTLYYKKLLAADYKRQLLIAKAKGGAARVNSKRFLTDDGEELIAIFDTSGDVNEFGEQYHPNNYTSGMPIILNGGVCFSFNCDEGRVSFKLSRTGKESIVVESNEYQRCGLCRFFKSSQQFLLEQIHYYNVVSEEIIETITRRDTLIIKSKEIYQNSLVDSHSLISHQLSHKIDDINLELAKLIHERERRGQLLTASLEKAGLVSNLTNLLPSIPGSSEVKLTDVKKLNLNTFDRCMEISTQAMILGLEADEQSLPMRKLQILYNKLSDITKNPNALLYQPDDEVKRVVLLYKLQHLVEIMGRTFTDEEFDNPISLFEKLSLNDAKKISQALQEFSYSPPQLGEN